MTASARPRWPGGDRLFLALAPMDGITDHLHREILTDLFGGRSGIDLCVSEFVRVTDHRVPARILLAQCPELGRGGTTRAGVPVFVQLLGSCATSLAETARLAIDLGAPGIDLNFGCPAPTVNRHDGGAVMLRNPRRLEAITSAVVAATRLVDAKIPVTVKIRTGWEDSGDIEILARAAEAGGAQWLTIHGRTRRQGYAPPVDWGAIDRARRSIEIPVIANGDVHDAASFESCAVQSGCHAFMIGRGAMAHPDLFARLRGDRPLPLDLAGLVAIMLELCERRASQGCPDHHTLGRLKQWLRMGAAIRDDLRASFDQIKRIRGLQEAIATLRAGSA